MSQDDSSKEHAELVELVLAFLSFASGSMDALAFFNLGQVFPSAMTGNTALLGLELGQGRLAEASHPLIAFIGFIIGAAIASLSVETCFSKFSMSTSVGWLLTLESLTLAAFALVWRLNVQMSGYVSLYWFIIIASSAMGIQSIVARLIDRYGISTVVFTSTLSSIVALTTRAMVQRPHVLPFATKRQVGMFLTYGAGAGVGGGLASIPMTFTVLPFAAVLGATVIHWYAGRKN
jgi:uncharacterized membrane protein YoaK (UPF0700 family)